MRRAGTTAVLGMLLAVGQAPDAAAREGKFFAAQINYLFNDLEGSGTTSGEILGEGTEFDFEETLGITEEDKVPEATVWFNFGRSSIMLSYFSSQYEGTNVLSENLTYQNGVFLAGTRVDSDFQFSLARLHYNLRMLNFDVVDFGFLVGGDLYSGDGEVQAASIPGSRQTNDFTAPFPVVGLNLTIKPPVTGLVIYVEASGMSVNIADVDASVLDGQARLTWYILGGPFGLSAGYRRLSLDVDVEDEGMADLTQGGFYGGVSVRF